MISKTKKKFAKVSLKSYPWQYVVFVLVINLLSGRLSSEQLLKVVLYTDRAGY